MGNIFVERIISESMNKKKLLFLILLISQYSFSNSTYIISNDSIDKNDDVYLPNKPFKNATEMRKAAYGF